MESKNLVIVIPAYEPNKLMLDLLVKLNESTIAFTDFIDNVVVLDQEAITSMVIDKKGRVNIFTVDGKHFMLLKNQYIEELDVFNIFLTDNRDPIESENDILNHNQSFAYVIYDECSYTPLFVFVEEEQCIQWYEEIKKRSMTTRQISWKAINLEYILKEGMNKP